MIFIFDCDGVIFDSNQLKNRAFESTLRSHGFTPEVTSRFLDHHRANGGISRYAKFEYLLSDLAPGLHPPGLREKLLADFSEACRQGYAKSPLTHQAMETLETLAGRHVLFVASGSDQEELRDVFRARGLSRLFREIYGSPTPKVEIVSTIVKNVGDGERFVMVGDSTKDYEAAAASSVPCVLMPTYSDNPEGLEQCIKQGRARRISSLSELLELETEL